MKKIISLVLITLTLLGCSTQAMARTYCNRKYEYQHTEKVDSYYNLKINGIYYNVIMGRDLNYLNDNFFNIKTSKIETENIKFSSYKDVNGKTFYCYVVAIDTNKTGKILKYPDTITLNGYALKVNSISFSPCDDNCVGTTFHYKEIYAPKYADSIDFVNIKLKNIKKIYLSPNVETVDGLNDYSGLKLVIDTKNKHIKFKNGAIFSKDGKELISIVNSKRTYKVSKEVKKINIRYDNTLENLILPNNKIDFDYSIMHCEKLKYIKFYKNTKNIDSAIFNCNKLEKIDFGSKLKVLGTDAVIYCNSIKTINLPKTLKKICYGAIGGCKNLGKIILNNKKQAPKIEKSAFTGTMKKGINFYVKNKKVAKSLKKNLKGTGVKNAKIYIDNTLVYSGIN